MMYYMPQVGTKVSLYFPSFGAAGPIIVGACIGGAMAVGITAVGDVIRGEVSSKDEYGFAGLSGAITGAISGGINMLKLGNVARIGIEIVEGFITGAVESVASQMMLEGKKLSEINPFAVGLNSFINGGIAMAVPAVLKLPYVKNLTDGLSRKLGNGVNSIQSKVLKTIDPKVDLKNPLSPKNYTRHGNYGEISIDMDLETKLYKRMNEHTRILDLDTPTTGGIDSVFDVPKGKRPPNTVILDAKFSSAVDNKLPSLRKGTTTNPPQLSDHWIAKNIKEAIPDDEMRIKILKGLANGKTIRVVGKVDSSKNIVYYLVDHTGKIMRDTKNSAIIWKP